MLLGALNVWLGEHEWLIVAHLTVGTLLWCSLVLVSLLALAAPERARRARARDGACSVRHGGDRADGSRRPRTPRTGRHHLAPGRAR